METSFTKTASIRSRADITVLALGFMSLLLIIWVSITYGGSWPGYSEMLASLPHPSAWLRWVVGISAK